MRTLWWLAVGAALVAALAIAAVSEAQPQASLTRLVPPPAGQAYFGLSVRLWDTTDPAERDSRPLDVRLADVVAHDLGGRAPTFFMVDIEFPTPSTPTQWSSGAIRTARAHAGSSLVVVNWVLGGSNASCAYACYHDYTTKDVAGGRLDAYLREAAVDVRRLGTPVLIYLMPEANAHNFPGLTAFGDTPLTAGDYRAAWRHVVDIFRQVGANNAAFAWVVHGYARDVVSDPNVDHQIGAYYPGDRYVDWVGSDTFDREGVGIMGGPYALAVAHSKPFIVARFLLRSHLSRLDPAEDVNYLALLFDWFESHPDVRAIGYVDARGGAATPGELAAPSVSLEGGQVTYRPWSPTNGYDDEDDSRLLADDGVNRSAVFAGRIANPRYTSTIATAPASARVRLARASQLTARVRGAEPHVSWRGNDVARSYDLEIRQPGHPWRDVLRRTPLLSDALTLRAGRYEVRVRARDAIGNAGPWSPPRAFRLSS